MNRLAKGRSNIVLPPQIFAAEINSMVSALDVFQKNVIQVKRMNADKRFEEEKNMEMLRSLRETSVSLANASNDIRASSNEFSERTKLQATSVEETAAAVFEITESVKTAKNRAEDAGLLVARTKQNAESSSLIVNAAIEAMDEINGSSRKIANIIGVIDEISFQTNLLALNAGVEAARAGSAGRGFAVVAQEIRDLAQRSANSSKEIKELITTSGEQVKNGVELVNKTGAALTSIGSDVQEVNGHVAAIVVTAREQSLTLQDINSTIGRIDESTRQNAIMVEQSTNATNALADELIIIDGLINQIEIADKEEVNHLDDTSLGTHVQGEGNKNHRKAA